MNDSERLADLEARLIAQEHRLFSVLQNFFVERPKWPKEDPRRDAAAKALLWRIFFSPGTVAVAGGTVGLATLVVFIQQNTLIKEQNLFFQEQVKQQKAQIEAQDRISTQSQRMDAIQVLYGEESNPRAKAEAVRTFVAIERQQIAEGQKQYGMATGDVNLSDVNIHGITIRHFDLHNVFLNGDLSNTHFGSINLSRSHLQGNLKNADFFRSNLTYAKFQFSDLKCASFNDVDLKEASFRYADLTGVSFRDIQNFRTMDVVGANMSSIA